MLGRKEKPKLRYVRALTSSQQMYKALFFDASGEIRPILVGPRDEDFPVLREGADCAIENLERNLYFRLDETADPAAELPPGLPTNLALRRYFPNSPFLGHAILYSFGLPEGEDPSDDYDLDEERSVIKDLLPDQLEYLSRLRIVYAVRSSNSFLFRRWGACFIDPVDPSNFIAPEVYSDVPVPQTVIPARDIMEPAIHLPEEIIDHNEDGFYDRYLAELRLTEIEARARKVFAVVLRELEDTPRK